MFSELFWTGFYTAMIGCSLASCNFFYKSKCKEVKCCCLKIIRDTGAEEDIDLAAVPAPDISTL